MFNGLLTDRACRTAGFSLGKAQARSVEVDFTPLQADCFLAAQARQSAQSDCCPPHRRAPLILPQRLSEARQFVFRKNAVFGFAPMRLDTTGRIRPADEPSALGPTPNTAEQFSYARGGSCAARDVNPGVGLRFKSSCRLPGCNSVGHALYIGSAKLARDALAYQRHDVARYAPFVDCDCRSAFWLTEPCHDKPGARRFHIKLAQLRDGESLTRLAALRRWVAPGLHIRQ